jgi:hypothetical protein
MKDPIRELETMAHELQRQKDELAIEARESGKETQAGFERLLSSVHKMHTFLFQFSQKLYHLAEDMKKES